MSTRILPRDVTSIEQSVKLLGVADEKIRDAQTPEEAEELLRSTKTVEFVSSLHRLGEAQVLAWQRMTLRAVRRYGELLGAAQAGNPGGKPNVSSTNVNGAERVARNQARKVASVPEDDFQLYILTT